MIKSGSFAIFLFIFCSHTYSQIDEIWLEPASVDGDSTYQAHLLNREEVNEYLNSISISGNQTIIGGYISSIYHEAIDSVKILIGLDGVWIDTTFTDEGLFSSIIDAEGKLVDLFIDHPDYHFRDTSFIFPDNKINNLMLTLEPKFKILLRGRVYAGNMPLEAVDVRIQHEKQEFRLMTRGCYYDKDDYWNCLFNGMFKLELTAEDPTDSIKIFLTKGGLSPYTYGMTFNEYQGEIMEMRMKYEAVLPQVPYNNLNLKLGFPFLSKEQDWFVSLSYYRLMSNSTGLKRIAYGLDANMYVTSVTVSHATFPGMDDSEADSSYINTFIGPSLLFWFVKPESRLFSSYIGSSLSVDMNSVALVPQLFIGSRLILDLNKALAMEFRYCDFEGDVTHYTFNPYGNAAKYSISQKFTKFHATLGLQIVF